METDAVQRRPKILVLCFHKQQWHTIFHWGIQWNVSQQIKGRNGFVILIYICDNIKDRIQGPQKEDDLSV